MRKRILGIALLGFAASIPLAALVPMVRAQDSDADKLREALRQAVAQTRSLEDQRTALQATIAKAQQDNAALKKDVDAARADAKKRGFVVVTKWGSEERRETSRALAWTFALPAADVPRSYLLVRLNLPPRNGVPVFGTFYFLLRDLQP